MNIKLAHGNRSYSGSGIISLRNVAGLEQTNSADRCGSESAALVIKIRKPSL
jgi:hypothetical protein